MISCASCRGETLPERTANLRGKRALVQFGGTSIILIDALVFAQTSLTTPLRSEHYVMLLFEMNNDDQLVSASNDGRQSTAMFTPSLPGCLLAEFRLLTV